MNIRPTGDWQPPEPEWMKSLREIDKRISQSIERFVRERRRSASILFLAGIAGMWVGTGTVQVLLWWAGLPR